MAYGLTGCKKDSALTADFDSPGAVATAFDNGKTVEGKTVLIKATMDSEGGELIRRKSNA